MREDSKIRKNLAILMSNSDVVKARYPQLFQGDFDAQIYSSFLEFRRGVQASINVSGIVIDMKTWLQFTRDEKSLFDTYFRARYPILEVSFQGGTVDTVSMQIFNRRWLQFSSLVKMYEPNANARNSRRALIVPVEVCRGSYWRETEKIRAFTSNVSPGGCFVVSAEELRTNERVLVRLSNFPDPIACRIAWRRAIDPERGQMPGVGMEFEDIDPTYGPRIRQLLSPSGSVGY